MGMQSKDPQAYRKGSVAPLHGIWPSDRARLARHPEMAVQS